MLFAVWVCMQAAVLQVHLFGLLAVLDKMPGIIWTTTVKGMGQ
jgi:hypothetical protein